MGEVFNAAQIYTFRLKTWQSVAEPAFGILPFSIFSGPWQDTSSEIWKFIKTTKLHEQAASLKKVIHK